MSGFLTRFFASHPGAPVEEMVADADAAPGLAARVARSRTIPLSLRMLTDEGILEPNRCYVRIEVNQASIPYQRVGTNRYHACVHGSATLHDPRSAKGTAAFQFVTSSELAHSDKGHADRILEVDQPLVHCAPYRGDLRFQLGLFSLQSEGNDMVAPYLRLLTSLSEAAGVSVVRQAMHFAKPIQDGLNLLLGAHEGLSLEVGLNASSDPVRAGTFLLTRGDPEKVRGPRLGTAWSAWLPARSRLGSFRT